MAKDSVHYIDNRPLIYEGSRKIIFDGSQFNTSFLHFKDSIRLPDQENQKYEVKGKGVINNSLSAYIFEKINLFGFQTHYILKQSAREQLIQSLEMLPVYAHVFNVVPDHIVTAMGIGQGVFLPMPVVEFYCKPEAGKKPQMITIDHMDALGILSAEEISEIKKTALSLNHFLSGFFAGLGLQLNDVKLEFGRRYNELIEDTDLVLADEISLDTCHISDMTSEKKFGYRALSDNEQENIEAYQGFLERFPLSLTKKGGITPNTQENIVSLTPHKK